MRSIIIVAFLGIVKADVSHLASNTGYQYPAPDLSGSLSETSEFILSQPKAVPRPPIVAIPRSRLHTTVVGLSLKTPIFTAAQSDSMKASGSEPIVYAAAPNSVFQTQINVQSQGSEFNSPKAESSPNEPEYDDALETEQNERVRHSKNGEVKFHQNYRSTKPKSYNDNKQEDYHIVNHDERNHDSSRKYTHDRRINSDQHNHAHEQQDHSNKNADYLHSTQAHREYTRNSGHPGEHSASVRNGPHIQSNDVRRNNEPTKANVDRVKTDNQRIKDNRKSANYQGVNLLNGNIAGDQASKLLRESAKSNLNTQGINIFNGSILPTNERSRQLNNERSQSHGSNRNLDSYRAYDRDYQRHRSSEDEKRTEHDLKLSPSEQVFELIYKSGDDVDFSEAKLVDFGDNQRPLENYKYAGIKGIRDKINEYPRIVTEKPARQKPKTTPYAKAKVLPPRIVTEKPPRIATTATPHAKAKEPDDGYHYSKPSVSFDS